MRETKFRGKTLKGNWVYGYLICSLYRAWIKDVEDKTTNPRQINSANNTADFRCVEVIPETVGQCTGLHDKNGKEIYEGDILHCVMRKPDWQGISDDYIAVVEDDVCNPCFVLMQANGRTEYDFVKCDLMELEVIGNIYESPELLEGGTTE